ncbi:hypothetical protein AC1031_005315 [Aphanomyces cochlioides]|nr:hypothetical protein AC1031_005315 [Aphanomyces cochlioides]
MRSGGLVFAAALSSDFAARHPSKTHINLAALMFAIYNYAASSVVQSNTNAGLQLYETRRERMLFEPVPNKQWLLVLFTSPLLSLPTTRHIAHHLGAALDSLEDIALETRAAYTKRFHHLAREVFYNAVGSIITSGIGVSMKSLYIRCNAAIVDGAPSPGQETKPVVAASSRWKRRLHALWHKKQQHNSIHPRHGVLSSLNFPIILSVRDGNPRQLQWQVHRESRKSPWNAAAMDAIINAIDSLFPPPEPYIARIQCDDKHWILLRHDRMHLLAESLGRDDVASSRAWKSCLGDMQAVADAVFAMDT